MDAKQLLAEIKSSFEEVKQQCHTNAVDFKSLKTVIDELERKYIELVAKGQQPSYNTPFGFQDPAEAKSFVAMCRSIFVGDAAQAKDLTEGTDSEGGYLVPPEFRATLLRMIETYGVIRQRATIIPMARMELNIPRLTSGVSVYWIDEGQTITSTQPVFGNLKLIAKKLAAIVPVTGELLEDSTIAIANLLVTLFAEAIAKEEDRVGFMGKTAATATAPFDGILYDANVGAITMAGGSTAFTAITADYLSDMIASVIAPALDGAEFFMHRTVFNVIRKLKDSTNNYIYQPPAGSQPGTIWGYPYRINESMPGVASSGAGKPFVAFGNLKHLYLGDRSQMSLAQSQHVGFTQDKIYLRAIERISIAVGMPQAFVTLKTAAA